MEPNKRLQSLHPVDVDCLMRREASRGTNGERMRLELAIAHALKKSVAAFTENRAIPIEAELGAMGCERMRVCCNGSASPIPSFRADVTVRCYWNWDDGADGEGIGEVDKLLSSRTTARTTANGNTHRDNESGTQENLLVAARVLPNKDFDGLWETLTLEPGIKERSLAYADTSFRFARAGVDPTLVSSNRVALLHGPPGTGKTTMCKAMAHKLSIRHGGETREGLELTNHHPTLIPHHSSEETLERRDGGGDLDARSFLLEINAASLFSRYFSESSKAVVRLFEAIRAIASHPRTRLVFVLMDEVECLSMARESLSAADPSDATRVVNTLLTEIDALKRLPNCMIFATSNLTNKIDPAFLDRADVKFYLGLPDRDARLAMLRGSMEALVEANIVGKEKSEDEDWLSKTADITQGASGRYLRKLPLAAHALYQCTHPPRGGRMTPITGEKMAHAFYEAALHHRPGRVSSEEEKKEEKEGATMSLI